MSLAVKKPFVLLSLGISGWAVCGTIMFVLLYLTTIYLSLIIHFIATPFIFLGISNLYFKRFDYTSPLATAIIFTLIVMILDFFVVAMVIEKNLEKMGAINIFVGMWLQKYL